MINTRAKVNILPKEILRSLNRVVYSTINYHISIITGNEFGFLGIAKLRVKVIKGVRYKNAFFLVKEALKILLN
jgi:hypothetical protein